MWLKLLRTRKETKEEEREKLENERWRSKGHDLKRTTELGPENDIEGMRERRSG